MASNNGNYYAKRNNENTVKLRELRQELPDFCLEYFIGIEQRTTPLTRLNYGYDLRTFFRYLAKYKFNQIQPTAITLPMMELVSATDIEIYLEYLAYYVDDNGVNTLILKKPRRDSLRPSALFFATFLIRID